MSEQETLPAGRELDRWIAERLGERVEPITHAGHDFNIDYHTYPDYPCQHCGLAMATENETKPCIEYPYVNAYSTDIAAAWVLVEHIRYKGYEPIVRYDVVIGGWVANIVTNRSVYKSFNADADTAPHAICLAYLALSNGVVDEYGYM
jgi:hypothetical protein